MDLHLKQKVFNYHFNFGAKRYLKNQVYIMVIELIKIICSTLKAKQ